MKHNSGEGRIYDRARPPHTAGPFMVSFDRHARRVAARRRDVTHWLRITRSECIERFTFNLLAYGTVFYKPHPLGPKVTDNERVVLR